MLSNDVFSFFPNDIISTPSVLTPYPRDIPGINKWPQTERKNSTTAVVHYLFVPKHREHESDYSYTNGYYVSGQGDTVRLVLSKIWRVLLLILIYQVCHKGFEPPLYFRLVPAWYVPGMRVTTRIHFSIGYDHWYVRL